MARSTHSTEGREIELQGIFPAVTTPFDGEAPALDLLRENLARYARSGPGGYLVLGSTAESVLLDAEERGRVLEAARTAIPEGVPLIAGVSAESTVDACRQSAAAGARGADYVLVSTPHYYREQMTEDALVRHLTAVADASPVPVLLYNVPKFTGLALPLAVVRRLADHPNAAGIKESSGDSGYLEALLAAVPRRFRVLCGATAILERALVAGARGGILAAAAVLPEPYVRRAAAPEAGTPDGGLAEAAESIVGRLGVAGVKAAMDARGLHGGPVRPPLRPVTAEARRRIDRLLAGLVERGVLEQLAL